MNRAVFIDRDGCLNRDVGLLTHAQQLDIFPDVPGGLSLLKAQGFVLVVVTNQPVVARGFITEEEVYSIHATLVDRIVEMGGPQLDAFYVCFHHPHAQLERYRKECLCRKPSSGMMLKASQEHHIHLADSYMIGDRPSDVVAGQQAGVKTIWLQTGKHTEPPIISTPPLPIEVKANYRCDRFSQAVDWIIKDQD